MNAESTHHLLTILTEISKLADHQIPYYAYGDNESACAMSQYLNEIGGMAQEAMSLVEDQTKGDTK